MELASVRAKHWKSSTEFRGCRKAAVTSDVRHWQTGSGRARTINEASDFSHTSEDSIKIKSVHSCGCCCRRHHATAATGLMIVFKCAQTQTCCKFQFTTRRCKCCHICGKTHFIDCCRRLSLGTSPQVLQQYSLLLLMLLLSHAPKAVSPAWTTNSPPHSQANHSKDGLMTQASHLPAANARAGERQKAKSKCQCIVRDSIDNIYQHYHRRYQRTCTRSRNHHSTFASVSAADDRPCMK